MSEGNAALVKRLLENKTVKEKDSEVVIQFLETKIMPKTIFLFEPKKDLVVGGQLYGLYKTHCKSTLGNGRLSRLSSEEVELYMRSRWMEWQVRGEAKKKICRGIKSWFDGWRSGIYEKVQQRFQFLCVVCTMRGAVLPSVESLTEMTKHPKIYFMVYKWFWKRLMTETLWDRRMRDTSSQALSKSLIPPQLEAFVLLLIANHYFSWVFEFQMTFIQHGREPTLMTEYDEGAEDMPCVSGWAVGNYEIEKCENNVGEEEVSDGNSETDSGWKLIGMEENETYESAKAARQEKRKSTIEKVQAADNEVKAIFDKMKAMVQTKWAQQSSSAEDDEHDDPNVLRQKRKWMNSFKTEMKQYTGTARNSEPQRKRVKRVGGYEMSGVRWYVEKQKAIQDNIESGGKKHWEKLVRELNNKMGTGAGVSHDDSADGEEENCASLANLRATAWDLNIDDEIEMAEV